MTRRYDALPVNGLPAESAPAGGPFPPHPAWLGSEPGWGADEPEINLMDYVRLVWAKRWLVLAVALVTVAIASAKAITSPKLYKATAEISVGERAPQIIRNQINFGPNYWELERYVDEQVRVLTTNNMAKRAAARLGLDSHPDYAGGNAAAALRGMITAERVEGTNMVRLTMISRDPATAAEWLNLYVDEYIAAAIDDNLERTRKVYEVIQSRLEPLREQLQRSEAELMRFRERQDALLFADQDKNVISEQVNTLTTEYAQAKAERIRLETRINALRRLRSSGLSDATLPEVLQNSTIEGLRDQVNGLRTELADKLRTLKEGHPAVQDLRSRIATLGDRIRQQIDTVLAALQTDFDIVSRRESSLYENIQLLKEQSIELSKQTMEYERLKRDYDQNKSFLEEMMARSKEVDISSTTGVNNVTVIEPALQPSRPFSPNIRRSLALGLVLGLFLGVGLVLGLDYLDQTLRSPEQIERYLGLEVLSILAKQTDSNQRLRREAIQSLRTALMLASRGEGCQVLVVTSAVPGEGKTTVALELARILAAGGGRVLLMDADLRRPALHKRLGLENKFGLTSVVLGECTAAEVLRGVAQVPNFLVIPSGPLPPNPPELFGKASFRRLLDAARQEFDWVVIDTPPIASVTDPVICSQHADMTLLVVEYGRARRQIVRDAMRQLARTGVRLAGAVFNKLDLERGDYYYSSYYYYRYYKYGYDDAGSSDKRGLPAQDAGRGTVTSSKKRT